jgi:hypothetical protein
VREHYGNIYGSCYNLYEISLHDALTYNNWQELKDIHEFLQLFFRIIKRQGREITLDKVLLHMDFLIHHFKPTKWKHRQNPHFTARLLAP